MLHRTYKIGNSTYTRPFSMLPRLIWEWSIIPWFQRKDYLIGKVEGTDVAYRIYVFRWEKYISPTIKKLSNSYDKNEVIRREI